MLAWIDLVRTCVMMRMVRKHEQRVGIDPRMPLSDSAQHGIHYPRWGRMGPVFKSIKAFGYTGRQIRIDKDNKWMLGLLCQSVVQKLAEPQTEFPGQRRVAWSAEHSGSMLAFGFDRDQLGGRRMCC